MTVPEEALPTPPESPAASREDWQRLVAGVLAKSGRPGLEGAAAEQALATEVEDGLRVQPLYTAQDTAPRPARGEDGLRAQPLYPAQDTAPGPALGPPGFAPFVRGGRVAGAVISGW